MHAVILAAQKEYYHGKNRPEAMDLVNGRPKLELVLENLPQQTEKIFFVLGYRGDVIKRHFGDCWQGRELRYLWQYRLEDNTQDVLHRARRMIKSKEILIVDSGTYEQKFETCYL